MKLLQAPWIMYVYIAPPCLVWLGEEGVKSVKIIHAQQCICCICYIRCILLCVWCIFVYIVCICKCCVCCAYVVCVICTFYGFMKLYCTIINKGIVFKNQNLKTRWANKPMGQRCLAHHNQPHMNVTYAAYAITNICVKIVGSLQSKLQCLGNICSLTPTLDFDQAKKEKEKEAIFPCALCNNI